MHEICVLVHTTHHKRQSLFITFPMAYSFYSVSIYLTEHRRCVLMSKLSKMMGAR